MELTQEEFRRGNWLIYQHDPEQWLFRTRSGDEIMIVLHAGTYRAWEGEVQVAEDDNLTALCFKLCVGAQTYQVYDLPLMRKIGGLRRPAPKQYREALKSRRR